MPPRSTLSSIRLLGVALDNLTSSEAIERIAADLEVGKGGWVFTPNLDILRRLVRDSQYADTTAAATLRLADGMPLIWASRIQGTPLPERVAGSEIIWTLCERAAHDGRTVFLLGGNPGTAETTAARLRVRYPSIQIVGIECPPLGFEKDETYLENLERRLVAVAPDLCILGLPSLKQDRLIRRLMPLLPRTWFLGIGVTFSFVAGEVKKAPVFIRRIGMEWCFRLVQEPGRLARRYLIEGIPFALRLFLSAACARLLGGPGHTSEHPGPQPIPIEPLDKPSNAVR